MAKSATKRSLGVILEDIDSKFDLILEGHTALDKKIDVFHDEFLDFTKETRLNFNAIKDYLSRIDDEIQEMKKILSRKADLERLERLEQKVAKMELVIQKWRK